MRLLQMIPLLLLLAAANANAQTKPLALSGHAEALGSGSDGTVMGIVFQIAPEDRDRAGDRVRAVTTLRKGDEIIDRQRGVVVLEPDGSVMLYREWDPGTYALEINIANLSGTASGAWLGEIEVPTVDTPFKAPEGAPVDAIALDLTPPREGGVSFKPPPNLGGLGAVQLEVEAPESTASVEFSNDGETLGVVTAPRGPSRSHSVRSSGGPKYVRWRSTPKGITSARTPSFSTTRPVRSVSRYCSRPNRRSPTAAGPSLLRRRPGRRKSIRSLSTSTPR